MTRNDENAEQDADKTGVVRKAEEASIVTPNASRLNVA
jgi:hypothetical protein